MDPLENLRQINRSENIDSWAIRIYFWSRSLRLLLAIAAVTLCASLAGAWFLQAPDPWGLRPRKDALQVELKKPAPDMDKVLALMNRKSSQFGSQEEGAEWIASSQLSAANKAVAGAFWESVTEYPIEPSADLLYFAHYVHPMRHANELIGDLQMVLDDKNQAITYYEREARHPDAKSARRKLFELVLEKRDFARANQLALDPAVGPKLTAANRLMLASGERRWMDIFSPLAQMQWDYLKPMPVGLALLAALVWFIIALQALQPPKIFCFRTIVPILAVLAGVVSIAPTLFCVLYQEEIWNLKQTGDFLDDLIFYVVGVGPREELCKLLLFLPFVPVLLARNSRLEMLMVAGCVGLGFALEENIQYFAQAGPVIAFGRFITANFFHLAATGIIGLAFCDWMRSPLRGFLPFLGKTVAVMLAHGFYDAFMGVSELFALTFISMLSFLLLALFFFRTLRTLRDPAPDHFSISATLILGISILNATALVCASQKLGFATALVCLAFTGFSLVMITYMFYWQLGEGMSHASAEEHAVARPYGL